jgi:NTP pyrophosphatase (non-canonical NTP hydrolase)
MTNLEKQIKLWHHSKFGREGELPPLYKKLLEEVGELGEAIMLGDENKIQEEVGDVGFVLSHIVRVGCISKPSLHIAMAVALDKNQCRLHKELAVKEK